MDTRARTTKPFVVLCFNVSTQILDHIFNLWARRRKKNPKNLEALGCGPACPCSGPALPIQIYNIFVKITYNNRHKAELNNLINLIKKEKKTIYQKT
jgi:hypothetical protein